MGKSSGGIRIQTSSGNKSKGRGVFGYSSSEGQLFDIKKTAKGFVGYTVDGRKVMFTDKVDEQTFKKNMIDSSLKLVKHYIKEGKTTKERAISQLQKTIESNIQYYKKNKKDFTKTAQYSASIEAIKLLKKLK